MTGQGRTRGRWLGTAVVALAASLAHSPAARAEDCTWGQPGYRACIDAKLEDLRKQEAGQAPKKTYKLAPASKRPPSLTPDTYVRERPRNRLPANENYGDAWNSDRAQRQFNANQGRNQRVPPVIWPYPDYNYVPGRICPQGGC